MYSPYNCVRPVRVYSRCDEGGRVALRLAAAHSHTQTDKHQTTEAQGELDRLERSACRWAAVCRTQRSPVCRGRLPTTFIHQSISAPNAESFVTLASIQTEVYLCIISQLDNPPNYKREEEEEFL